MNKEDQTKLNARMPLHDGPLGIKYDFNGGCRVWVPERKGKTTKPWRVRMFDSENVCLEDARIKGGTEMESDRKYFTKWRIVVWFDDEIVFEHTYDARGKKVLIYIASGALGDNIAWTPAAFKFAKQHSAYVDVCVAEKIHRSLFGEHENVNVIPHGELKMANYYATYPIGMYLKDPKRTSAPRDCRSIPLQNVATDLLGLPPSEDPPKVICADGGRPIAEPYVCIATQATTQCKYWNNPLGWHEVVKFLKDAGYRVVCIDGHRVYGRDLIWNHIPHGVEDETGFKPISERVRWLRHADFFIGLPSGLSWLAWAAGCPVVMISGFSASVSEFFTPYRVESFAPCKNCWNDPAFKFDAEDYFWCPRHKGDKRQYECSRMITSSQVKDAVRRIPGFKGSMRDGGKW